MSMPWLLVAVIGLPSLLMALRWFSWLRFLRWVINNKPDSLSEALRAAPAFHERPLAGAATETGQDQPDQPDEPARDDGDRGTVVSPQAPARRMPEPGDWIAATPHGVQVSQIRPAAHSSAEAVAQAAAGPAETPGRPPGQEARVSL